MTLLNDLQHVIVELALLDAHIAFSEVCINVMLQAQTILGSTAKHGKTILQFAARSGSKESFETVLAAVKESFDADKVNSVSALEGFRA